MKSGIKSSIEKEVKKNKEIKANPEKMREKKEAIRKYKEDMARYMNGITMVNKK